MESAAEPPFRNIFEKLHKHGEEKPSAPDRKQSSAFDSPEMEAQRFDINNVNISLINYKENRLADEIKAAVQIEQSHNEEFMMLKTKTVKQFEEDIDEVGQRFSGKVETVLKQVADFAQDSGAKHQAALPQAITAQKDLTETMKPKWSMHSPSKSNPILSKD